MQVLKVKASDIIAFHVDTRTEYGEIGPGRTRHSGSVWFEVYPIHKTVKDETQSYYEYAEEPVWVDYRQIEQHFRVRNKYDFHQAWISLDFNPMVSDDHVYFERMQCCGDPIPNSKPFETLEDLLMTDNDDESFRSVDTYSTEASEDSALSDLIDDNIDEIHEHDCDCVYCTTTRESVKWFDRDWKPMDETESKVKSFIEYLERKYT